MTRFGLSIASSPVLESDGGRHAVFCTNEDNFGESGVGIEHAHGIGREHAS